MRNLLQLPFALAASLAVGLSLAAPAAADVEGAPLPSTLTTPKVYVFPLKGQMGSDISAELLKAVTPDIRKQKPDIIVYQLESADIDRINYLKNDDPREFGLIQIEMYRDMLKQLREDFRDIPQVMWVEDSVGFGSLLALGWPRLYMKSDARLWGLSRVADIAAGWDDADVQKKMEAAWTGMGKGLMVYGGYPVILGDAMMLDDKRLSVRFKGREVEWLGDTSGTWIVDNAKDATANFSAEFAEDVLLSDGTADSIEDLMYLLGYREFTKLDSGEKLAKQYVDQWRKALERVEDLMSDFQKVDEPGKAGLGKRKNILDNVLKMLTQYPVIERRREMQQAGVTRANVERLIDNLRKDIQRINDAEKSGRSGGRGGSGGSGGRPGSPGGPGNN